MTEITAENSFSWVSEGGWVHVRPLGLASATTWRNVADVTNFLAETPDLNLFVEIGANYCGWAALMVARTIVSPSFGYLGIEIEQGRKNGHLETYMKSQPRCKIIWQDCFDPRVIAEVKEWIDATQGKALVWCDGTNKPKEMEHYHPLLRPGDYLMLHDYSEGDEGTAGNPNWLDCKPLVDSGDFVVAMPDYWAVAAAMFLMQKVK